VTERLLEVMTSNSKIMPHLHLPLQAGSCNILRKMARQYSIEDYMQVIETVKNAFDRPAITTDIIVGFPGETEDDFNATYNIAKHVKFAKIHVFSFSPRENTPAEKMAKLFGKIPSVEIKRRSTLLQELDDKLQEEFRQSCRGLKETVIVEKTSPPQGRTTRYFMVDLSNHTNGEKFQKGQLVNITV
jgi:threonylcarbamoyladenosine tRNA methylthiotransferase MtaB